MFPIDIDPNITVLGQFTLSWHGLFTGVAMVVAVWLALFLANRYGINEDDIYTVALVSIVGGIVGARLFHVVDEYETYIQNPSAIIAIWNGGAAIYGGIVGGAVTCLIVARIKRLPIGLTTDIGALALVIAQAVGRLGDVINGEHHASMTTLPISVRYIHPNTLGEFDLPVHLAVGYELIWDVLIFGVLAVTLGKLRRPGMVFWIYACSYGIGRFFLSFLRDDRILAFGLRQAQIVALVVVVVSIVALWWLQTRGEPARYDEPAQVKATG